MIDIGVARKPKFAFVTPSYPRDLDRCRLLVESVRRCCPKARHFLIVDRYDLQQFSDLASETTILLETERVVDRFLHRLPTRHGVWISTRTLPVRGWIMQQIRKIASVELISEETLIFCDSDMAFIRPFDESTLMVDEQIGLLDVPFENAESRDWTRVARRLLGLPQGGPVRGHVGQMICWKRDVIIAMQRRIEQVNGKSWQLVLARLPSFSEYVLYGVFVREFLGYAKAAQAPSQVPLVKTSWDNDIATPAGMRVFFEQIDDRNIALMAHSKDAIDWHLYCELIQQHWKKSGVA